MAESIPYLTNIYLLTLALARNNMGIEINKQTLVDDTYRIFHNNKHNISNLNFCILLCSLRVVPNGREQRRGEVGEVCRI